MGAMICYLKQLGFTASNLTQWERKGRVIPIEWGDLSALQAIRLEIDLALQEARWEQVEAHWRSGQQVWAGLDCPSSPPEAPCQAPHSLRRTQNGVARSGPKERPRGPRRMP